jgi:hypothetical protein
MKSGVSNQNDKQVESGMALNSFYSKDSKLSLEEYAISLCAHIIGS